MAAADEDEPGGARVPGPCEARQVGGDRCREQFHLAAAGLQGLRQAGAQRAEVDAVRVGEEPLQGQPVGPGAKPSP